MQDDRHASASGVDAASSPWTHYLVLDFEATCERNDPTQKQWSELIEFPCVLLDANDLRTVGEFSTFVRPTQRQQLTAFCTELTSITQDQVDAAQPLEIVLKRFSTWLPEMLGTDDLSRVLPITCGEPDLQYMLPNECKRKGLPVPAPLKYYCNIKKPFSGLLACKAGGMTNMLRQLNLRLEGVHHRGIDDARNIARLVVKLVQLGAEIDVTGGNAPSRPIGSCGESASAAHLCKQSSAAAAAECVAEARPAAAAVPTLRVVDLG